jgi:hypothetical protein
VLPLFQKALYTSLAVPLLSCTTPVLNTLLYGAHLQDACRLAWAGLRTAKVLHARGIVHTDFRLDNFAWLDDEHAFALDLELCRRY